MAYTPEPVPQQYDPYFLARELYRIAADLAYVETGRLRLVPVHVDPSKPREGDVVNADGVDWNPGGTGAGLYQYLSGAWVKL